MALLWQPEVMYLYLAVIEHYSVAVETVEAAAGAIQNLTACNWKVGARDVHVHLNMYMHMCMYCTCISLYIV